MRPAVKAWACALGLALAVGCGNGLDAAGGSGVDAGADEDPLAVPPGPDDGSLDHIQREIISVRCSGVPGLCHASQFEPNLSTAAMTYNYLVNRPGIEKNRMLRVAPGNASASLLIDKLRGRDVDTQMPLGAEPLSEDEIRLIEAWIDGGALRRPGADPAPVLNNAPSPPEIAVFDGAVRLDAAGPFSVPVGTVLTLRHSVNDFEVEDAAIPFALFVLQSPDGREVVFPGGVNGRTTYDASGPPGAGDLLDYRLSWSIPSMIELRDPQTDARELVAASGMTLNVFAVYIDGPFEADDTMVGFAGRPGLINVE